ncbi:hypothetical protein F4780DRAFT_477679 [Xylariomycetidae sp. FL0641]|nr:hypothetical protein F4780DRAFT_477679 [Xylariomycetidae sp. FL0641]
MQIRELSTRDAHLVPSSNVGRYLLSYTKSLLVVKMAPFTVRAASLLSSQTTKVSTAPKDTSFATEDLSGEWHMIASSSSFWLDRKHSISITYTNAKSSNASPGTLDDVVAYYMRGSAKQHSTKGTSTPSTSQRVVYDWRGWGLLRLVSTRWEVVGYGSLATSGGPANILVTLAQKTTFSPQSLSIYSEKPSALAEDDIVTIMSALRDLENDALSRELDKVRRIEQSS